MFKVFKNLKNISDPVGNNLNNQIENILSEMFKTELEKAKDKTLNLIEHDINELIKIKENKYEAESLIRRHFGESNLQVYESIINDYVKTRLNDESTKLKEFASDKVEAIIKEKMKDVIEDINDQYDAQFNSCQYREDFDENVQKPEKFATANQDALIKHHLKEFENNNEIIESVQSQILSACQIKYCSFNSENLDSRPIETARPNETATTIKEIGKYLFYGGLAVFTGGWGLGAGAILSAGTAGTACLAGWGASAVGWAANLGGALAE